MSDYYQKRAKEILSTIKYATIATVSEDGKPSNSPVAHSVDGDLTIYWASDKNSQHSQNIRANENVAVVIYDSTAPEGTGEGLYFEATAIEINTPEEIIAHGESPEKLLGDAIRRFYKATPLRAWMNDVEEKDGHFVRDCRVEISLELLS